MQRIEFPTKRLVVCIGVWLNISLICSQLRAQDLPPAYAITNVTIHQFGKAPVVSGTVIWRDGVVTEAGNNVSIPFDAYTIDGGDSLHIYPGFIDGLNTWGSPKEDWSDEPKLAPGTPTFIRAGVRPQRKPSDLLVKSTKEFENALKNGFTAANLIPIGRMLPGSPELFLMDDQVDASDAYSSGGILFQFEGSGGGWTDRAYPSTDMAVIAKFRQLMYDAIALNDHLQLSKTRNGLSLPVAERDPVLMALIPILNQEEPLYFYLDQSEDLERFFVLQDEFGFKSVLVTSENITEWADELKRREIPVLATLRVPKKPKWMTEEENRTKQSTADSLKASEHVEEVEDSRPQWKIEEERLFRARQKQAWMSEIQSIGELRKTGVKIGYAGFQTTLKDLRSTISDLLKYGVLTQDDLLGMMTVMNADILGLSGRFGTIDKGSIASFSVFDKEFSAERTNVVMTVSNGQLFNWTE